MKRDPLLIAAEYLREPDPRIRKNALMALAAIGDAKSIELVVGNALKDNDEQVRERAEKELVDLEGETAITNANSALNAAMDDEDKQERAYLLAARLQSQGLPVQGARRPFKERLRLAAKMWGLLYPTRNRWFRLRGLAPGFFGGIWGAVLFLSFLFLLGVLAVPVGISGGGSLLGGETTS